MLKQIIPEHDHPRLRSVTRKNKCEGKDNRSTYIETRVTVYAKRLGSRNNINNC